MMAMRTVLGSGRDGGCDGDGDGFEQDGSGAPSGGCGRASVIGGRCEVLTVHKERGPAGVASATVPVFVLCAILHTARWTLRTVDNDHWNGDEAEM